MRIEFLKPNMTQYVIPGSRRWRKMMGMKDKRRGKAVSIEKLQWRLIEDTKKHLETTLLGLIQRIDWYFYQKFREPFIYHLFKEPKETIDALLDYFGAETIERADTARYVLYAALKRFFLNNRRYYEKAYESLLKGRWKKFQELVNEFLKKAVTMPKPNEHNHTTTY